MFFSKISSLIKLLIYKNFSIYLLRHNACGDSEFEITKKIGKSILNRNGISVNEINQYYSKPGNTVLTIGIIARITNVRNPDLFNNIALRYLIIILYGLEIKN